MPVLTKINTNSIAEDAITGDKFAGDAYLANTATQNISGTYSENRLYTSDAYTLSGNATVNSHLTLSSVKDSGDIVLTAGGAYTITGTGTLSGGDIYGKNTLTGMTGELGTGVTLGSVVTGSPNLNLGNASGDLPVGVTGGSFDQKIAGGAMTATAVIDIQGCFTSDYKFYKLLVGGYSVDAAYLEVGYLDSTNGHITDTYYTQAQQIYAQDGNGGFDVWTSTPTAHLYDQQDDHGFHVNNTWQQRDETEGHMLEMLFYDPNSSTHNHVHWFSTSTDLQYVIATQGWGVCNTVRSKHGIRLNASANTFDARGHFAVYGYRV